MGGNHGGGLQDFVAPVGEVCGAERERLARVEDLRKPSSLSAARRQTGRITYARVKGGAVSDRGGEHDFGAFDYQGQKIFWKFDYYDLNKQFYSEDPADPAQTCRVLTIMLASEY